MQLTAEQEKIINFEGNVKINAVAGSGKTTTIIEYARARPSHSRILYLAFNKTVKLEAAKKFTEKGIKNVTVETAHSLAYRHIVFKSGYKVKTTGYKTNEITTLLHLESYGQKHGEYIIANHINKFISYFCNSNKQKVQELNYLDTVDDKKTRGFLKPYYPYIEKQTRLLLAKMDKGEIEITHDFYLKKFQLSNPTLQYDYILFDEGQDASGAMLDVFLKQAAVKVIVGDTHQQIYGWRFAVNSMDKAEFPALQLSSSFRFNEPIANLANQILEYKKIIGKETNIKVRGMGGTKDLKTKAVIARTNLGLLLKAIDIITVQTKNMLYIPEKILPASFTASPQVQVVKAPAITIEALPLHIQEIPPHYLGKRLQQKLSRHAEKNFYDVAKTLNKDANKLWTNELDLELTEMYCKGIGLPELASHFG